MKTNHHFETNNTDPTLNLAIEEAPLLKDDCRPPYSCGRTPTRW